MQVLYLIDSLSPGGAEHSLAALAPHLGDRDVRLTVGYLSEREGLRARIESHGIRVVSLSGSGGRRGAFSRARHLVAHLRPDLVHTTLFEADLLGRPAARLAGVPVVTSLVNDAYGPAHLGDQALRRWRVHAAHLADAATAQLAVRFHAISRQVAAAMTTRLALPASKVDVIYRGRDPRVLGVRDEERRARTRTALGVDRDTPLVLAAARQEHQKGLDILLEAFPRVRQQLPRAQLVIAGREGNQTDKLHAQAARRELAGAVRFLGARTDVPDLLCAADVFVLPSRWEGLAGVVLEAMALRTPIVTSALPAVAEAVDEHSALLVPPERPLALTRAIITVLSDESGAALRAAAAHTRFHAHFAIDGIADQMAAFYRRAQPHTRAAASTARSRSHG